MPTRTQAARAGVGAPTGEPAISISGLVKTFGEVRALDGVDLEVQQGTVLGLLGPNGAGKTTAVRVLATLLRPDAGTIRVLGLDVVEDAAQLRQRIGLAGQYAAVDENLTGLENLVMVGRLYGEKRAAATARALQLLEQFDLVEASKRPAKTYSGGMRRRLDLPRRWWPSRRCCSSTSRPRASTRVAGLICGRRSKGSWPRAPRCC